MKKHMKTHLKQPLFPMREAGALFTLVLELGSVELRAAEMILNLLFDTRSHNYLEHKENKSIR